MSQVSQNYDEETRTFTKTWPGQYDEWYEEQKGAFKGERVKVRWVLLALEPIINDRGVTVVREVWTWSYIDPGETTANVN